MPILVKDASGAVAVPIYPTPVRRKGKKWASYTVCWTYDGRRHRVQRASLRKARAVAQAAANAIATGQAAALALSAADVLVYTRARAAVAPLNVPLDLFVAEAAAAAQSLAAVQGPSLGRVIEEYVTRHPARAPQIMVPALVTELLAAKTKEGLSRRWITDLQHRLGKFARSFQERIRDLRTADLTRWLAQFPHARTRNNYRTALATLYSYATTRGYLPRDWPELAAVPRADRDRHAPVGIFSPAELTRLLAHATPRLLPYLVLGAFVGLRTSESVRARWEHIRWPASCIVIEPLGRTPSRRLAPLTAPARAWLEPLAQASGPIVGIHNLTNSIAKLVQRIQKSEVRSQRSEGELKRGPSAPTSDFRPPTSGSSAPTSDLRPPTSGFSWRHNALRHSFISYRTALLQNTAQVADECGNSPRMIATNYRELVSKEAAAAWFAILPVTATNITSLRKAS